MYDILIKNGQILNGTGSPAIRAEIAAVNAVATGTLGGRMLYRDV